MMHQYNVIYAIYIMFSDVPRRNVLQGLSWIVNDLYMHYLIERVQDFRKWMPQLHRGYFFHPSSLDFVKHRLDAYFLYLLVVD